MQCQKCIRLDALSLKSNLSHLLGIVNVQNGAIRNELGEIYMNIIKDDLSSPAIAGLLEEHLEEMRRHSPPESVHALDLEKLRQSGIQFWSIWKDEELVGCGALKMIESERDFSHAEIKSMRVTYKHQGKGIANIILEHLISEAKVQGVERLSLETGSMDAFARARSLYAKYGFQFCGPFADYAADPNSVFMTRALNK